MQTTR